MGAPAAAVAVGASVGGTLLKIEGRKRQRKAEIRRLRANKAFFKEQAGFISESGERQEEVFKRKADVIFGEQVSAFASGGVDVSSGSALSLLAETRADQREEVQAIRRETAFRVRLAELRAQGADADIAEIQRNAPLELAGDLLGGISSLGGALASGGGA